VGLIDTFFIQVFCQIIILKCVKNKP